MDAPSVGLFVVAAVVLLGSPGPAVAALVAIGRGEGFSRGLRFYAGLQIGLALAAAASATGLLSILQTHPVVSSAMTVLATLYLLYLAYRIATSPSGAQVKDASSNFAMTSTGGFLLGVTNPKAYMAFASLMGSYSVIRTSASADVALKWLLCVAVMIIVDIAWLWAGSALQKANPKPVTERVINVAMGATILFTALVGLL